MTQYFARIVSGIVAEIITIPDGIAIADCFVPDIVATLEPATSSISVGQTFADGAYGPPPAAPAPLPPSQVALWAAKGALAATSFDPSTATAPVQPVVAGTTNLLAAVNAVIAHQNNPVLSAFWANAGTILRSSPALAQIAAGLNLSTAAIDALFVQADATPPL